MKKMQGRSKTANKEFRMEKREREGGEHGQERYVSWAVIYGAT